MRDLASARTDADPDLIWDQANGVKRCRPLPEIVGAIEQRAHDLSVPLTPHERATERAAMLAQRVDGILTSFRTSGQLKAFNACYRTYRVKMNGHAPPYHAVLADLRGVLIRTLVEVPRRSDRRAADETAARAIPLVHLVWLTGDVPCRIAAGAGQAAPRKRRSGTQFIATSAARARLRRRLQQPAAGAAPLRSEAANISARCFCSWSQRSSNFLNSASITSRTARSL